MEIRYKEVIREAEGIARGVRSDYEWNYFTNILNAAKSLTANDGYAAIDKRISELRNAIELITITSMASENTGKMNIIPYNNNRLTAPIQTGLHGFPLIYDYDCDGDGIDDIIVDGAPFLYYHTSRVENGIYYLDSPVTIGMVNISGHNHGFTVVDWNRDGVPDIASGSESGYFYYLMNDRKPTYY